MLTDARLRDLLRAGYETSDADLVAKTVTCMRRTVYLMTQSLAERKKHFFMGSDQLQERVDDQLRISNIKKPIKKFNPVDWFSAEWKKRSDGNATPHFEDDYLGLFDRQKGKILNYGIKSELYEKVVRVLSELGASTHPGLTLPPKAPDPEVPNPSAKGTGETTLPSLNGTGEMAPGLSSLAEQLNKEGVFDPISLEDARYRALRAVIVREGQPQFRAALLAAYGGRCAITGCDAVPALEAAHVKPYEGVMTNVLNNGILLRADIHTLFDLDLIGIDPSEKLVCISNQLDNTVYREIEGTPIRRPNDPSATPNRSALAWRWERFLGQGRNTSRNSA